MGRSHAAPVIVNAFRHVRRLTAESRVAGLNLPDPDTSREPVRLFLFKFRPLGLTRRDGVRTTRMKRATGRRVHRRRRVTLQNDPLAHSLKPRVRHGNRRDKRFGIRMQRLFHNLGSGTQARRGGPGTSPRSGRKCISRPRYRAR